ncbi:single-stranded-DNA-specific exonuclease RecJ, partial [Rhizobium leguminosarum]|nr:single-stranded-DNA-specific exonuclease RecJ [Rhizobium leguminosarum]
GNMRPVFATDLVIAAKYKILKENHLKLTIQEPSSGVCMDAIGFGLAKYAHLVCDRKPFRIAYTIEKNNYQGQVNLQLNIKGLQPI